MIDLYFWPTTNCYKILIMLEDIGMPYRIIPINISENDQFTDEFKAISSNSKIPVIVDHEAGVTLSESGAILFYLLDHATKFIGKSSKNHYLTLQWLFWQTSGLGPALGQKIYLNQQSSSEMSQMKKRVDLEILRLLTVLELQLTKYEYVTGEAYSIADIACYPWLRIHQYLQLDMAGFSNINRWLENIESRAAISRAYQIGKQVKAQAEKSEDTNNTTTNLVKN